MKKMSKFAVAAMLVLGLASGAQAADIKATGAWQIDATWSSNGQLNESTNSAKANEFRIEQRIRTAFQFIANENLKGVLDTQIGSNSWGNGEYQISAGRTPSTTAAGSNTAGSGNIMLRKAYLDYKWPGTQVNVLAGFQTVKLPAAFGSSSILDDQVGALVVAAPIVDGVKVVLGYARPYDSNTAGATATVQTEGTSTDVFFATVPVDLPGNTSITPFGMFANGGYKSVGSYSTTTPFYTTASPVTALGLVSNHATASDSVKAYWGGVAVSSKLLDPFKIMADFNYGSAEYSSSDSKGRAGWLADIAVDYTGLSFMTPEAFFVYTSGDDSGSHSSGGRMPMLGNPQGSIVDGSMFFGNGDLVTRTLGSAASTSTTGAGGAVLNSMGFWTAGLALKDISFIDKLSHRINVMYVQGTNDKNAFVGATNTSTAIYGSYLTDKDSLWEFDLNSKYKVYDELTFMLSLGYINADLHKYNGIAAGGNGLKDDAYRITMSMAYSF